MKGLTYKEIREEYLKYFKNQDHTEIPSASLVPEDDPTLLFINAGMVPLVPFLKGEIHPQGQRLVNSQRCLRTGDIDLVGDDFHVTTFEMLGNWSLNDYFKKEAISMTFKFFVETLGIDVHNIYATVFEGDETVPADNESVEFLQEVFKSYGIDAQVGEDERIIPLGREDNWWGLPSGGPCGPDCEIFLKLDNGELVELGNNVFMEYLLEDGEYKPLGRHNVDFGGGLDRISTIIQGVESIYEIDIYKPIFEKVRELSITNDVRSQRIIVDHIKSATWIVMDGIKPGKSEQGYVLRRLIRRAVRHGKKLGIEGLFTKEVADVAIAQFKEIWPNLETMKDEILLTIEEEEKKFNNTIKGGIKILEKMIGDNIDITGKEAFNLYETYGFPIELTDEILKEKNLIIKDRETFEIAQKEHQEKSRSASAGFFKGGLADTSEQSTKYHTATHLLLAALRKVLGDHVYQKGSNINPERLRLDFPNETKLTPEQLEEVENIVNDVIKKELDITYKEFPQKQALELVPFAAFGEKYGEIVKVYFVGDPDNPFSTEICNGPHVSNTKELGEFKIVKQENIGAGIKRIKAILK